VNRSLFPDLQIEVGDVVCFHRRVRYDQAGAITAGVLFLAIVGPAFSMMGLYAKGWLPVRRRGRI